MRFGGYLVQDFVEEEQVRRRRCEDSDYPIRYIESEHYAIYQEWIRLLVTLVIPRTMTKSKKRRGRVSSIMTFFVLVK